MSPLSRLALGWIELQRVVHVDAPDDQDLFIRLDLATCF